MDEWHVGLFGCCKDGVCRCLQMTACIYCMNGRAISLALERDYVACCLCGLPSLCCMRRRLRIKYNLEGTKSEDCTSCMFCLGCTSWQLIQEVEYQQKVDIHWSGKVTEKETKQKRRKKRHSRKSKMTQVVPAGTES